MQSASQTLNNADTYGALTTSVSVDALSASASTDAIAGQYSITVDQLAKAQTLVTSALPDREQAQGTGGAPTVTLNTGHSTTMELGRPYGKETVCQFVYTQAVAENLT